MKKSDLIAMIYDAFDDVPYPGDDNIACPKHELQHLVGYHWQDLPLELLYERWNALSFLTFEGLHHFLPVFLIGFIRDEDQLDDIFFYTPIWFAPPKFHPYGGLHGFKKRVWMFNKPQKKAIHAFLTYFIERCLSDEWIEESGVDFDALSRAEVFWNLLCGGQYEQAMLYANSIWGE